MNNCPNCGAPFLGTVCQYCGTTIEDIFNVKAGEPVFISLVYRDKKVTVKLLPTQFEFESCYDSIQYADDSVYYSPRSCNSRKLSIVGDLVSFDWNDTKGVTCIIEELDKIKH